MLIILYPSKINWFYEEIAHKVREDLVCLGIECQAIPAATFTRLAPGEIKGAHAIIISLHEIAHSIGGTITSIEHCHQILGPFYERLKDFRRRVFLNLDAIHTPWFKAHLDASNGILTDIFDLTMAPQTRAPTVAGLAYTWIPESFTVRERGELPTHRSERPIPWALIGHQTVQRCELADALIKNVHPGGFIFLPSLRPYYKEGSRNLSSEMLGRVLGKTDYYIWASHHEYPYHEGFRALHALGNGAVPVKLDPLFAHDFKDIPWVYSDIEQFQLICSRQTAEQLYNRALQFVLDRRSLGEYIIEALDEARCRKSSSISSETCAAPSLSKEFLHENMGAT